MTKLLLSVTFLCNTLLADQMSSALKEGCEIIVQSHAKKWTSKSVPSAYYIHGLTDMNLRYNNQAGRKINNSLVKNYNQATYITCKQALLDKEKIDFREKLYFYNNKLVSSYYK